MVGSSGIWWVDHGGYRLFVEWWREHMKTLFFAVMGVMLYAFAVTFAGRLEGRLWPVVDNVEVTRVMGMGETATRFWGSFDKVRECQFDSLEFYLGGDGNGPRADFIFEEAASERRQGAENFGPWLVQLTPDQLQNRSFSIVKHKCHPLWLTETVFHSP